MLSYNSKGSTKKNKLKEDSRFSHKPIPTIFHLDITFILVIHSCMGDVKTIITLIH